MTRLTTTKPPRLPASTLASIVAKARTTLPASTGSVAAAAHRMAMQPALTILADTSRSMHDRAGAARKIDALKASLAQIVLDVPDAELIAFSTMPQRVKGVALPEPNGGTAMHLALDYNPEARRLLVISDGAPDSATQTLSIAHRVAARGTTIDTLFIGDDSDHEARAFMRRLAEVGRGRALNTDIRALKGDTTRLTAAIRLLAAPK